jgi:hypothetical protein
MKIKPVHLAQLEAIMRVGLTRIPSPQAYAACHESIPRIHLAKDRAKRHRWDALYAVLAEERTPIIDDIYRYANDEHIDTALRAIVAKICKE